MSAPVFPKLVFVSEYHYSWISEHLWNFEETQILRIFLLPHDYVSAQWEHPSFKCLQKLPFTPSTLAAAALHRLSVCLCIRELYGKHPPLQTDVEDASSSLPQGPAVKRRRKWGRICMRVRDEGRLTFLAPTLQVRRLLQWVCARLNQCVHNMLLVFCCVFVYCSATAKGFYVNRDHQSTNPKCWMPPCRDGCCSFMAPLMIHSFSPPSLYAVALAQLLLKN